MSNFNDIDPADWQPGTPPREIRTEDGARIEPGQPAFNYYDQKPGFIVPGSIAPDGWFLFRHTDDSTKCLNGERICSLEFAQSKGWVS